MRNVILMIMLALPGCTGYASTFLTRDAALRTCNAEAKQRYPGKYYDWDSDQIATYKSCMHQHGQVP